MIERDMRGTLAHVEEVESVEVDLVFDPPWTPDHMADEARFLLGVDGG